MKYLSSCVMILSFVPYANCIAATSEQSPFPKVIKGQISRRSSINPLPQPDGELSRPPYSAAAIGTDNVGETIMELSVNERGAITDVSIVKSSGSRQLDSVAKDYAKSNWKFFPALINGKAVASKRTEIISWSSRQ